MKKYLFDDFFFHFRNKSVWNLDQLKLACTFFFHLFCAMVKHNFFIVIMMITIHKFTEVVS